MIKADAPCGGTTMALATLTSKGQITIPKRVREGLGVAAGDRIAFIEIAPGRYENYAATHDITELKGIAGKATRAVSVEEMNKAIEKMGRKLIGLDTNVIVCYIMQDDPEKVAIAVGLVYLALVGSWACALFETPTRRAQELNTLEKLIPSDCFGR